MLKKLLAIYLLFSSLAFAETENRCGYFQIQISNMTKGECVLSSQQIIHGTLDSPPPLSISPNDSKHFEMEQTLYGPGIILSYQCGAEIITLTSQQNLCVLEAGNISGSIKHPLPINLNASYTALSGSYFWKKPGSINWSIVTIEK